MRIESKYISIPNVVMNDNSIANNSKLLYGLIRYWDFVQKFSITYEEISEQLNVSSVNSIKKYLRELKANGYIDIIKVNQNKQVIKPLVTDGIMLQSQQDDIKLNRREVYKEAETNSENNMLRKLYERL